MSQANTNNTHTKKKREKQQPIIDCPCQSGKKYADCCAPFLLFQKNATTPELLMRSRYTAYVLKAVDYLIATWHPQTLPKTLSDDIATAKWLRLKIISASPITADTEHAEVEFIATYRTPQGKAEKMHEVSRFIKQNDHWFYVDGTFIE